MGHLSSNAAAMLTAVVAPMLALLAAPAEAATLRFRSLRPPALGAGPHGFMYHGDAWGGGAVRPGRVAVGERGGVVRCRDVATRV